MGCCGGGDRVRVGAGGGHVRHSAVGHFFFFFLIMKQNYDKTKKVREISTRQLIFEVNRSEIITIYACFHTTSFASNTFCESSRCCLYPGTKE
jgi:hypothetical protein